MSAVCITVREAILSEINGHTWLEQPETFTATSGYYIRYKETDLATVKVSVIGMTQTDTNATRLQNQTDLVYWIDLQRKVTDAADASEIDTYVAFLSEMKDFFSDNHRLNSLSDWWVEDAAFFNGEFWNPQRLYADRVYEAAIELTVRNGKR